METYCKCLFHKESCHCQYSLHITKHILDKPYWAFKTAGDAAQEYLVCSLILCDTSYVCKQLPLYKLLPEILTLFTPRGAKI